MVNAGEQDWDWAAPKNTTACRSIHRSGIEPEPLANHMNLEHLFFMEGKHDNHFTNGVQMFSLYSYRRSLSIRISLTQPYRLMKSNALLTLSKPLLTIWTRFLPNAILSRSSSTLLLSLGTLTFIYGFGMSLYSFYQDLHYLYLEHKISRSLDQLDQLEAKSTEAARRYEVLEQVIRRGDRMVEEIEKWEEKRKELENLLAFKQMPAACAMTDETDPRFEGYDAIVQRKETRRKMKELVAMDQHLNDEMKWWTTKGKAEIEAH
ncbi:hypothetical protein GYMLUDRAFT_52520 [Collybiopsis luxurians FD-317 M1]|nr:hypothetical protein GYMLUDRAFT_52520 [Collybiopsis luxurians FD-317 M1]